MTSEGTAKRRGTWPLLGLALTLFFPSTAFVQRHLGLAGVLVYLGIASCLLWLGYKVVFWQFIERVSPKWAVLFGVLSFLVLAAIFLALYPLANSGVLGGGSDGDDALNVAVTALLDGEYPYYPRTYLNNPISPLPGSLLLAIPFVLFGSSAYQNLVWLVLFIVSMGVYLNSASRSLLLLWALVVLSPALLHALAIGSDYVANSLFVLLFAWWLIGWASRPRRSGLVTLLLAVLLGIGLASRANFVLILPLIFSSLGRRIGWRPAGLVLAGTVAALAATILPFLLYDPAGFTPLRTYGELGRFDVLVPWAGVIISLLAGLTGVALAFQDNARTSIFFRNCTIVLAIPVVCGTVLASIQFGRIDFSFAFFGVLFLFFGAVAFWPDVVTVESLQALPLPSRR